MSASHRSTPKKRPPLGSGFSTSNRSPAALNPVHSPSLVQEDLENLKHQITKKRHERADAENELSIQKALLASVADSPQRREEIEDLKLSIITVQDRVKSLRRELDQLRRRESETKVRIHKSPPRRDKPTMNGYDHYYYQGGLSSMELPGASATQHYNYSMPATLNPPEEQDFDVKVDYSNGLGSTRARDPRSSANIEVIDLTGSDDETMPVLSQPRLPAFGRSMGRSSSFQPTQLVKSEPVPPTQPVQIQSQAQDDPLFSLPSLADTFPSYLLPPPWQPPIGTTSQTAMGHSNIAYLNGVNGYAAAPLAGPPSTSAHQGLQQLIHRTNNYDWMNMKTEAGEDFDKTLVKFVTDIENDDDWSSSQGGSKEDIDNLLQNIKAEVDVPPEDRVGTPRQLVNSLYEHQKIALKWMSDMETGGNKGGILADDMGLGKTISTLALMVTRPSENKRRKTNLIVGPVALVRQWEREIRTKLKRGSQNQLSVFLYHSKKAKYEDMCEYDVVLTTYGVLAAEFKRLEKYLISNELKMDEVVEHKDLHKSCPLLHPKSKWYRVILDEAQCIKNKAAQASQGAHTLDAIYRWCLTGTPMMNNVKELYPLIRFLRIKPYCSQSKFTNAFKALSPGAYSRGERNIAMQQLQAFLKAVMLRRTKSTLIDGRPIVELPEKIEEVVHVVFSEDEQLFYDALQQRQQIIFNRYVRAGTVNKNYANILVLLLRLRQACCHPHLIQDVDEAPARSAGLSDDELTQLALNLPQDVVVRLLDELANEDQQAFECPVCYEALTNPLIFPCGHLTCTECLAKLTDSARQDNMQNGSDSSNARCPFCRGPIEAKQIINMNIFKKAHLPGAVTPDEEKEQVVDDDDDDSDSDSDSDANDNGDLRDFIVPDDYISESEDIEEDGLTTGSASGSGHSRRTDVSSSPSATNDLDNLGGLNGFLGTDAGGNADTGSVPNSRDEADSDDELESSFRNRMSKLAAQNKKSASRKRKIGLKAPQKKAKRPKLSTKGRGKQKLKIKEVKPHLLADLRREAIKNKAAHKKYVKYLRKNWQPSAKVTKTVELLQQISATGEKTIVFSSFTTLLDLLEVPIKYDLKLQYCRYDGSMSSQQRDKAVHEFINDPNIRILIVSLRAGNAGLNLVAANNVIILDPYWNPYTEMQAVDRAYRIGQRREVRVYRILIKGTVEDRIVELQEKKRDLVESALDEGEAKALSRLSFQDLNYLFGLRG